jgi:hypothetical protein
MLAFSRAVEVVLPFEKVIAFGTVAYDNVVSLASGVSSGSSGITYTAPNVLAVSALTYQGSYLIALSAKEASLPMQVSVNATSTSGFLLHDLIRGTIVSLPANMAPRFTIQQMPAHGVALVALEPRLHLFVGASV